MCIYIHAICIHMIVKHGVVDPPAQLVREISSTKSCIKWLTMS